MAEAYLDACCLIYMTEGTPAWRAAMAARLRALPATTGLATSRLECRSKPIRDRDAALAPCTEIAVNVVAPVP